MDSGVCALSSNKYCAFFHGPSLEARKGVWRLLQPLCGLLQPLYGYCCSCSVGCHSLCVGYAATVKDATASMWATKPPYGLQRHYVVWYNLYPGYIAAMWDVVVFAWANVVPVWDVTVCLWATQPLCSLICPLWRILHPRRGLLRPLHRLSQPLILTPTN